MVDDLLLLSFAFVAFVPSTLVESAACVPDVRLTIRSASLGFENVVDNALNTIFRSGTLGTKIESRDVFMFGDPIEERAKPNRLAVLQFEVDMGVETTSLFPDLEFGAPNIENLISIGEVSFWPQPLRVS